jgi:hypothetical protein
VVDVRQQPVGEALGLGEGQVLLRGVEGDAQDLGTGLGELWGSITEPLSLQRSAGRRRLGVPPQHDPRATLIGQANGVPVLIRKGEVGGSATGLDHDA